MQPPIGGVMRNDKGAEKIVQDLEPLELEFLNMIDLEIQGEMYEQAVQDLDKIQFDPFYFD